MSQEDQQISRVSQNNPLIERIIQIQDPNVQKSVKDRIKQRLMCEAQILLEKKKREQQKKQRIKFIQEKLEKKRQERLKNISQRINKSDRVMEKNKQVINRKLKQQQDYFKTVINKIEGKQRQNITLALARQKQMQNQQPKSVQKLLSKNVTHTSFDSAFNNSRYAPNRVQQMLSKLQTRTKKALLKHDQHKKLLVDKLRQKSETIAHVQEKAFHITQNQQEEAIKNWTNKTKSIQMVHETIRSERERRALEKKKSMQYRIQKCSQNLRNLSYHQQERHEELNNKFNRRYQGRDWKDDKLEKYWKIWEDNSKKIFEQKIQEGDKILNKHQKITDQNKYYKERKQKLLQAIKSI